MLGDLLPEAGHGPGDVEEDDDVLGVEVRAVVGGNAASVVHPSHYPRSFMPPLLVLLWWWVTLGLAADLMYQSRILASYMSGSSSYISHFIAGYWGTIRCGQAWKLELNF